MRLAVIVPILDRASTVEESLCALAPMRRRGHCVIVVDGGSRDDGPVRASALADRVVLAPRGWSRQVNAGGRAPEAESADALVFLPEGVHLPPEADRRIAQALGNGASPWGFFDLHLFTDDSAKGGAESLPVRFATALANAGSRLTGVGLADQAIFVTRAAFLALEGFSGTDESADIEFSRRARLLGAPLVLGDRAQVRIEKMSSRTILQRAARREWYRLALALDLPWRTRRPFRWSSI